MGVALVLAFVKYALTETFFPSSNSFPPSGISGAILLAILMGIVGAIIGLIVGAFGLRTYQGAVVGLLFAALRWSAVYDTIHSLARTIQAGHFSLRFFADDIQRLSIFLDFVIVGALVSIAVQRLFAR